MAKKRRKLGRKKTAKEFAKTPLGKYMSHTRYSKAYDIVKKSEK